MRKFCFRALSFSFAAMVLLLACEAYYFYSGWYQEKVNGTEVYYALRNSKKKYAKVKRLILGDSVAMQLYPCTGEYDDAVSLTCNAAITVAGFYFLMNNYLKNNPNDCPDEIVFLVSPWTLKNNMNSVLAFHYFLKPFYTKEYKNDYTPNLYKTIHNNPYYWLSQVPFVRSSSYCVNYKVQEPTWSWIAPIVSDYIQKADSVCGEYGVNFRMIPSPVRADRKQELESTMAASLQSFESPILNMPIMQQYMQYINYADTCFFRDNIHFQPNNIPQNYLDQFDTDGVGF